MIENWHGVVLDGEAATELRALKQDRQEYVKRLEYAVELLERVEIVLLESDILEIRDFVDMMREDGWV